MSRSVQNKVKTKPWQLDMFQRSLKKQLKLKALFTFVENDKRKKRLLITCGDNNGALNFYFRENGGLWSWADVSDENLEQIKAFLGEEVHHANPDDLPFHDSEFDFIVAIDVLEHLSEDQPFLHEIKRILKPGGDLLITVPNGDPHLLANRIKIAVGMSPEKYGHTRAGYTLQELDHAATRAGFIPIATGGYSRFFTEMVELGINYAYVFKLSEKNKSQAKGHIAPVTAGEFKSNSTAYKFYTVFYPVLKAISSLDRLLPAKTNNAVIVKAQKPATEEIPA